MTEDDRKFWIVLGISVFYFSVLLGLIVVGMLARYRMEQPIRPPEVTASMAAGEAGLLGDMRLELVELTGEPGARISVGPVTNGQFGWFLDETGAERPWSFDQPGRSGGGLPVLVAELGEAEAFCGWLSRRIRGEVRVAGTEDWTDGDGSEPARSFRVVVTAGGAGE